MDLVGAWQLIASTSFRDGVGTPAYGVPPAGQLQYSADGRMSAFLMNPDWAAAGKLGEVDSFNEFFAYAGRWQLDGDVVTHDIEFASVPDKVGTRFVRRLEVTGSDTILLHTQPEVTRSGRTYTTELSWQRWPQVIRCVNCQPKRP
jgi:hypothetical protein